MFHSLRQFLILVVFAFPFLHATQLEAVLIDYDVDLSGTAGGPGHFLQVTGTITADTVTNMLTTSNLTFFHDGDGGTSLPTNPVVSGTGFTWDASLTELRFQRTSTATGFVSWNLSSPFGKFELGTGNNSHQLVYGGTKAHSDRLELFPAGGAQSPGFLVGTAAVPEPSAFLCVGLVALGLVCKKRRSLSRGKRK